jgi:hypothetical protein
MAYTGSTLNLVVQGIGGTNKVFYYSTTDAAADIDASGYISDATQRGMAAGDQVVSLDTDSTDKLISSHSVSSVTAGAANLSNGITVGGGSNSD